MSVRHILRFTWVLVALLLTACYTVCALPLFFTAATRDMQDADIELTVTARVATNRWIEDALYATLTATYAPRADPLLLTATAFAATDTATLSPCVWVWNTMELPELSVAIQAEFDAQGMTQVEAWASNYGEDCIDAQTNERRYFAAMTTDFNLRIPIDSMDDPTIIANIVMDYLTVLQPFLKPHGASRLGYVTLTFVRPDGTDAQVIRTSGVAVLDALAQGYDASSLYMAIQTPTP